MKDDITFLLCVGKKLKRKLEEVGVSKIKDAAAITDIDIAFLLSGISLKRLAAV